MKLKNLSTLTIAIGSVGIITILFSLGWHIRFPDWSQTAIIVCLGIIFLGFAYLCQWTRKIKEDYDELDQRINSMDMWAKKEFNKINQKLERLKK